MRDDRAPREREEYGITVDTLWSSPCGTSGGGGPCPELKRHQKERVITGWYLRNDTVSFQVLKYQK